ncbi:MAG: hypothetical protein ACOYXU_13260 [Nitrospirota bacterium]
MSEPAAASPTFNADVISTYVIQLIVSDGTATGAPDTVEIVAN